jgi:hypothetical protein
VKSGNYGRGEVFPSKVAMSPTAQSLFSLADFDKE